MHLKFHFIYLTLDDALVKPYSGATRVVVLNFPETKRSPL